MIEETLSCILNSLRIARQKTSCAELDQRNRALHVFHEVATFISGVDIRKEHKGGLVIIMDYLCRLVFHISLFNICNDGFLNKGFPVLRNNVRTLFFIQHDQTHKVNQCNL